MITSYHTHTSRTDGDTPLAELIDGAIAQKIDELGVSDHLVMPVHGRIPEWSMPLSEVPEYVTELQLAKNRFHDDLTIRLGIEADFDPQTANDLAEVLRAYPFDYVIGSIHFVDGFPIDRCAEDWNAITQRERNDIVLAYWEHVRQMAESGLFDFAGHLDLYKKFGHRPTVDIAEPVTAGLRAIAAADMAAEINTAGWFKPVGEAYPSLEILAECRALDIPILINADAHHPDNLTRCYPEAAGLARSAGYDSVVAYAGRRRNSVPLTLDNP